MRHPSFLPLAILLAGCSPDGWLRSSHGAERIRTAFHFPTTFAGVHAQAMVLSNSHFPCSLPDTPDPDAITQAQMDWANAWNREGSMLVAFVLYRWEEASWEGNFPVDEAASPFGLDEVEPRVAMAAYRAVWEAEVSEEDGLYREYEPVVEEQFVPVEGPGTIELEVRDGGTGFAGTFSLDAIDVSGRFHSSWCADGGDLIDYLDLFDVGEPDPRDTGFVYDEEVAP